MKKKEKQHGQIQTHAQTYTSIQLTVSLRDRLKDLGKKGESYEDIIERLLEVYQQTQERK